MVERYGRTRCRMWRRYLCRGMFQRLSLDIVVFSLISRIVSNIQSIARLGANTLAIDASPSNISVAQTHATLDPSLNLINSQIPRPSSLSSLSTSRPTKGSLEYRHCAAEDLEQEGKQFDVVCAMEVIEHVEDPRGFLECLMNLTKVLFSLCLSLSLLQDSS